MDSGAHVGELQMPMLDGFGGLHESSMLKLLTSGMPEFLLESQIKEKNKYRECLRNHQVSVGGHAIDGCGEFMAGGKEGTPDALKCAACDCHRSFHRREEDCDCHRNVHKREVDLGANEGDLQMPMLGGFGGLPRFSKPKLITSSNGTGMFEIPRSDAKVHKTIHYRECLRNHQVSIGGHAVDGCGEFMGGGEEGSMDALKCAACECHRSFHRREVEGEPSCGCYQIREEGRQTSAAVSLTPASTGPTDSDDRDGGSSASAWARKKRFRTKFSSEQIGKMAAFADKLEWRIQKHDERAVQAFCVDIGVSRHLLKVWMHNNKFKRARA